MQALSLITAIAALGKGYSDLMGGKPEPVERKRRKPPTDTCPTCLANTGRGPNLDARGICPREWAHEYQNARHA